jgi:hypothetical protein
MCRVEVATDLLTGGQAGGDGRVAFGSEGGEGADTVAPDRAPVLLAGPLS